MFNPSAANPDDPDDLRGGCRAPRRFIDWQTFFDFGDGLVRPNKRIDTTLSTVLFNLMGQSPEPPPHLPPGICCAASPWGCPRVKASRRR
ncbi:MAG: hypothetical protein WKF73_18460 [Nocardioidaceae bacterium]